MIQKVSNKDNLLLTTFCTVTEITKLVERKLNYLEFDKETKHKIKPTLDH